MDLSDVPVADPVSVTGAVPPAGAVPPVAPAAAYGPFRPPRPRRLRLDFERPCPPDWMAGNFTASCMMNTFSLVFPALETIMVRHLLRVVRTTTVAFDEATMRGFLHQEGTHSREHRRSIECIRAQGYHIRTLQRCIDWVVLVALDTLLRRVLSPVFGDALGVAIFAAAEHWTTTISEIAIVPASERVPLGRMNLEEAPEDLTDMEILFLWHVAEEIEHKTVVADLLRALRGRETTRIAGFLITTPVFLLISAVGVGSMLWQARRVLGKSEWRRHGGWRRIVREGRSSLGDVPVLWRHAVIWYLRRGFHPSDHDTDALVGRAFDRLHALRQPQLS
jgi:predicted metal-dependent hydrolase